MNSTSFFDTAMNGFDIGDLGVLLGALIAAGAIALALRKGLLSTQAWLQGALREMIREEMCSNRQQFAEEVSVMTAPIQKDGNGGRSLADANRKLDLIAAHLELTLPPQIIADKE